MFLFNNTNILIKLKEKILKSPKKEQNFLDIRIDFTKKINGFKINLLNSIYILFIKYLILLKIKIKV